MRLMNDAMILLEPSRLDVIVPIEGNTANDARATTPPVSNLMKLLADIYTLFLVRKQSHAHSNNNNLAIQSREDPKLSKARKTHNHVTLKLAFYAAKASAIVPDAYDQLRSALRRKITEMEGEARSGGDASNARTSSSVHVPGESLLIDNLSSTEPKSRRPLIEEIS